MISRPRNPPWADLPEELLSAISNSLTSNPLDMLSFRSVCNPWRSSCPPGLSHPSILSPLLPLSIPRPPFSSSFHRGAFFITVTVIYALRRPLHLSDTLFSSSTPNSWILFVDETVPGKLSVRKPFCSFSIPCNFPKCLNLIDFNAHEIGRYYNLAFSKRPKFGSEGVDKVVLFPSGLAAVAVFDEGKLGICKWEIISGISEWEIIHDGKGFRFDDIVEFKGRVLGIDRRGRIYQIGYDSSVMKLSVPPIAGGGGRRKRLVESLGKLYLVVRCNVLPPKSGKSIRVEMSNDRMKKTKFKVYELDESRKRWFEMTSIGDRSFFFDRAFSFSVCAQELGTSGKTCILFKKQSFPSYSRDYSDNMLFSKTKNNDLDIGVCHLNDSVHSAAIESYPGYLDVLWPPPPWVWTVNRLKRHEIVDTAMDEIVNRMPEKLKSKFQELAVEGDSLSRDDFQQHDGLEIWMTIQLLKTMLSDFKEHEQSFRSYHDDYSTTVRRLNQMEGALVQARTAGLVTEKMQKSFDEFQSAIQSSRISTDNLLNSLRPWFMQQNAMIFRIEELASELLSHYYSAKCF